LTGNAASKDQPDGRRKERALMAVKKRVFRQYWQSSKATTARHSVLLWRKTGGMGMASGRNLLKLAVVAALSG